MEVLLFVVLLLFLKSTFVRKDPLEVALKLDETEDYPEWIDVQFIDEGNPSRTGEELDGVNDIVIHYVGNPVPQLSRIEISIIRLNLMCAHILWWAWMGKS